jgi:mutator protein MutT
MVELHFVAKALVLDEAGNALLLRRSKTHPDMPLNPDLPGGSIEPGETPAQAVCREIDEETGLRVQPARVAQFYANTRFYKGKSVTRYVFVARVPGKTPAIQLRPEEHDSFEWLPLADIATALTHPVYSDAIAYLLEHNILEELAL